VKVEAKSIDPVSIGRCCKRPQVCNLDYQKATPTKAGPYRLSSRVNRVCTSCWTHWFGAPTKVRTFSKEEWDIRASGVVPSDFPS
jgi:hypothetical protein